MPRGAAADVAMNRTHSATGPAYPRLLARRTVNRRIVAAGVHAVASVLLAGLVGVVGLGVMYPGVYTQLAGGFELFLLICGVDVTLGPLLTGIVFSPRKGFRELRRDLLVIVTMQLAALVYGIHVLAVARPVALVFEVDRFRVISQADVVTDELASAPAQFRNLSWAGPRLTGARAATDDEKFETIEKALAGFDIGQRPSFWQPYELKSSVRTRAFPAGREADEELTAESRGRVERELQENGLAIGSARFLPLQARQPGWVVWLDAKGYPKLMRRYEEVV